MTINYKRVDIHLLSNYTKNNFLSIISSKKKLKIIQRHGEENMTIIFTDDKKKYKLQTLNNALQTYTTGSKFT